ncbi:PepSY domain-containing protein [Chitinimonas arctica]|uniref:PepSY domain-containing protein n=1 Tax=Chitinimonas arctica TaxID=2594795 RepID=A0A516SHF4_9NEIS|nr:PepSY domain-containing protein [Chitinimonas arctica]QDQ27601.1 PepSY domain-containing protein [Chitinimonas arctica]
MKKLLILLGSVLLSISAPAWADVGRDDAAAIAQRVSGGRVLSVERAERDGHAVWRVKVVTGQGEVKVIFIDAASGRTL